MLRVAVIDAVMPAFEPEGQTAGRRVSHGEWGHRKPAVRLITGDARPSRHDVTRHGNATQHQGFQGSYGHGRPPAINEEKTVGARATADLPMFSA